MPAMQTRRQSPGVPNHYREQRSLIVSRPSCMHGMAKE